MLKSIISQMKIVLADKNIDFFKQDFKKLKTAAESVLNKYGNKEPDMTFWYQDSSTMADHDRLFTIFVSPPKDFEGDYDEWKDRAEQELEDAASIISGKPTFHLNYDDNPTQTNWGGNDSLLIDFYLDVEDESELENLLKKLVFPLLEKKGYEIDKKRIESETKSNPYYTAAFVKFKEPDHKAWSEIGFISAPEFSSLFVDWSKDAKQSGRTEVTFAEIYDRIVQKAFQAIF